VNIGNCELVYGLRKESRFNIITSIALHNVSTPLLSVRYFVYVCLCSCLSVRIYVRICVFDCVLVQQQQRHMQQRQQQH